MSLAFWRSVCDLQLICDNVRISQSCDNILFCWVRGGTWTNFQRISSKKVTYDSRKLCCCFFFLRIRECSNKHQAALLNCLTLCQYFHVPNGWNVLRDGTRMQHAYSRILLSLGILTTFSASIACGFHSDHIYRHMWNNFAVLTIMSI